MHPQCKVQSVEVVDNGTAYTADYFVENGIIVASVDKKIVRVPVGFVDPHKTVRALLTASIHRTARLAKNRDEWTSVAAEEQPRGRGRPKLVRPVS